MKKEIRKIIDLWIYPIHKNDNKNINYRKIVTSLYSGYPKPVVYCWKNRCKSWVLIKTRRKIFCGGVWRGRIFHGRVLHGGFSSRRLFEQRYTMVDGLLVLGSWIIWRGSNKLGWSIYQLFSLNLGRGLSSFGKPLYQKLCISKKVFSCYRTLLMVVFHFKKRVE